MTAAPEPHPVKRRVVRWSLALPWSLLLLAACFVAVRYPHGIPPGVERLVGVGSGLFFAALGLHYLIFAPEDGPALRDLAYLLSFGRRDHAFLYTPGCSAPRGWCW